VPAATPLPRGPSILTLYCAADLLTAPGCPVCRYAAEASDRYMGWFALEGHAQPGMIATLGGSLGMCAAHSRRLIGQPGAAIRLTAVYRYVVTAARDRLAGGTARIAACPACEHDDGAAGRALETLLDGLDDNSAADRCRDLGGLCIPHFAAAAGHSRRRIVAWLGETMQETLAAADLDRIMWLAGADADAEARAVLRASVRDAGGPAPGACAACMAAMRAERGSLSLLPAGQGRRPGDCRPTAPLCGGHLADAAASAAKAGGLRLLLTEQAAAATARTRSRTGPLRARPGANRGGSRVCPACQARGEAERQALADLSRNLRESQPSTHRMLPLCARHHLDLRATGKQAPLAAARSAAAAADLLARELAEEFERTTWARRRGARAPEPTAWRRAAAFLDGTVFGCSLPR
jgi:hypothetical protein